MTRLLQLALDGPGNVQSWVVRHLIILLPFSLIDHWTATPRGVILAPGMCLMQCGKSGIAHSKDTSLLNALFRAALFSGVCEDL